MLFCQDIEIRRRAIHEAGHAVFMWRGGETLYGDRFNDRLAPFDEILVNRYDYSEEGGLPSLMLEDGRTLFSIGAVVHVRRGLPVPVARSITGLSRAQHRALIAEAKLGAQVSMINFLAGPVVQEHFRAIRDADERYFSWIDALEDEETTDGDVTRAFAIAEQELCRGPRQTVATMDNAVQHIQAKLDGDKRYLRTIEALADALGKQFRLEHDEAVAVMCAAWPAE
jgi:hypothetical protein